MRMKTLIILALLFFIIGGVLGGGYAFFYHIGGDAKGPVVGVLPPIKSPEDKIIDEFIEKQEQKQAANSTDEAKESDDKKGNNDAETKDNSDDEKQNDSDDKAKDDKDSESKNNEKPEENKKPAGATGNIGKPTVSDGTTLRVRTEPNTDSEVLVGIPNTEEVVINSSKNGWYNITTSNGTKGWVSSDYIEIIQ